MGASEDAGGSADHHNDETPGQIDSGREFRETETGSSGNYPSVREGVSSLKT